MKRIIKYTLSLLLIFCLINALTPFSQFLLIRSINNQINYLEKSFSDGLGDDLQAVYSEGALFGHLLFALSLIEYNKGHQSTIEESILTCVSSHGKEPFDAYLEFEYGAFYNGWVNYTLKKYIESPMFECSKRKDKIRTLYKEFTNKIITAQKDSLHLLETYQGGIWPPDNLVCIASLPDSASGLKTKWLRLLNGNNQDGLIVHYMSSDMETRGCSSALMNYFLNDSKDFSDLQYLTYKEQFVDNYGGISLVKEYYSTEGTGDVDSGPLVFGYGSVATIMNAKLLASKQENNARINWAFLNTLGIPVNGFGQKYYLFKKAPMLDVFMLWISIDLLEI